MITCEPIIVMAPTPDVTCEVVQALVSTIYPLKYVPDFRPFSLFMILNSKNIQILLGRRRKLKNPSLASSFEGLFANFRMFDTFQATSNSRCNESILCQDSSALAKYSSNWKYTSMSPKRRLPSPKGLVSKATNSFDSSPGRCRSFLCE